MRGGQAKEPLGARSFDVLCAGEPLWRASMPSLGERPRVAGLAFVDVTRKLVASGLRVGWAAVLDDDRRGRALLAEMAALDVDVGAVRLVPAAGALVVVDASGAVSTLGSEPGRAVHLEIPPAWSSRVLLLSGLKPLTASLAALCKAARRARREGAVVVLDLVGSLREWSDQNPKMISMVLREVDVVCGSLFDLTVLGTDTTAVRQAMRRSATLVLDEGTATSATGTFGVVRVAASREANAAEPLVDGHAAAVCAELARPRAGSESPDARWHRVLGGRHVQRN